MHKRIRVHCRLAAALLAMLALSVGAPSRASQPSALTVLTGNQATYSITAALLEGTPVQVQNVPEDGREMAVLPDYIARRKDSLVPAFAAATAVVTLTNALPEDPLYRFARQANIRIVNIDAAVPWSPDMPGVALVQTPVSNVRWGSDPDPAGGATAPYLWLSLSNAIRMADIVAHDLAALFPQSAPVIAANLDRLKRSLLRQRGDFQSRLIESESDLVFALTGDFIYLTNDMGLLVDGYFIKQDVRWTAADLAALTRHLEDHGIKVVLHKWQPSEAIQKAVRDGGARLVVLDAGDTGVVVDGKLARDGLQQVLRKDLEAILAALKAP
ncbi:MAG TPA: zinc ABC transporter substrate-binding protein [Steroidobacteraceae bacterium]|nr:zinc ABC transporter substrate-binding protein [Steroidobacteraceae bacterium]